MKPWQDTPASQEDDADAEDGDDLVRMGHVDDEETVAESLSEASKSANQSQGSTNYQIEKYGFGERLAHYTPGNVFKADFEKSSTSISSLSSSELQPATKADTSGNPFSLFPIASHTLFMLLLTTIDSNGMSSWSVASNKIFRS